MEIRNLLSRKRGTLGRLDFPPTAGCDSALLSCRVTFSSRNRVPLEKQMGTTGASRNLCGSRFLSPSFSFSLSLFLSELCSSLMSDLLLLFPLGQMACRLISHSMARITTLIYCVSALWTAFPAGREIQRLLLLLLPFSSRNSLTHAQKNK